MFTKISYYLDQTLCKCVPDDTVIIFLVAIKGCLSVVMIGIQRVTAMH